MLCPCKFTGPIPVKQIREKKEENHCGVFVEIACILSNYLCLTNTLEILVKRWFNLVCLNNFCSAEGVVSLVLRIGFVFLWHLAQQCYEIIHQQARALLFYTEEWTQSSIRARHRVGVTHPWKFKAQFRKCHILAKKRRNDSRIRGTGPPSGLRLR